MAFILEAWLVTTVRWMQWKTCLPVSVPFSIIQVTCLALTVRLDKKKRGGVPSSFFHVCGLCVYFLATGNWGICICTEAKGFTPGLVSGKEMLKQLELLQVPKFRRIGRVLFWRSCPAARLWCIRAGRLTCNITTMVLYLCVCQAFGRLML